MLIDRFLPEYHFTEIHTIRVFASPDRVYRAIMETTPGELPFFRILFALRSLPARFVRRGPLLFSGSGPLFEQALSSGFVLLEESQNQELVLGAVGQFWKPVAKPLPIASQQEFLDLDRPDYAKAVLNFSIDETPGYAGVMLRTETRVSVPNPATRRTFALYWFLIGLGRGWIRRIMLRAIKRRAEKGMEA
jgi:hypothetical protein